MNGVARFLTCRAALLPASATLYPQTHSFLLRYQPARFDAMSEGAGIDVGAAGTRICRDSACRQVVRSTTLTAEFAAPVRIVVVDSCIRPEACAELRARDPSAECGCSANDISAQIAKEPMLSSPRVRLFDSVMQVSPSLRTCEGLFGTKCPRMWSGGAVRSAVLTRSALPGCKPLVAGNQRLLRPRKVASSLPPDVFASEY